MPLAKPVEEALWGGEPLPWEGDPEGSGLREGDLGGGGPQGKESKGKGTPQEGDPWGEDPMCLLNI